MLDHVSVEELKAELRKRKQRKLPKYVRSPVWWKILWFIPHFWSGLYITALSPIWAPFWFTHIVWDQMEKQDKERAIKAGFEKEWEKYHQKIESNG